MRLTCRLGLHGLPIETQVEKSSAEKGKCSRRSSASYAGNLRRASSSYTRKISSALACSALNDPYLTMSPEYEATRWRIPRFRRKGYVYRGRKPVYWCIHDSTALAEAESNTKITPARHLGEIWRRRRRQRRCHENGRDVSRHLDYHSLDASSQSSARISSDFEYAVVETEKGALLLATERITACSESSIKKLASVPRSGGVI